MNSISVNQFKENLKHFVEQVMSQHIPLKVTLLNGENFVVISAEDWEREQETLYVLQNSSLMQQMTDSMKTHSQGNGYSPNNEELKESNKV
jgi:antitoxin YefM